MLPHNHIDLDAEIILPNTNGKQNFDKSADVIPSRVPRLPCCTQTVISGEEQDAGVVGVKSYVFMQDSWQQWKRRQLGKDKNELYLSFCRDYTQITF